MIRFPHARIAIVAVVLGIGVAGGAIWWRRPVMSPPPSTVAEAPVVAPEPTPAPPKERKETVTLKRGDTLVKALANAGVETRAANEIAMAMKKAGAELRRLKPGHELEIVWSPAGDPTAVSWQADPWLGYAAVAGDAGWTVKRFETTPEIRVEAVQGSVERSLFQAVDEIGETPPLVLALVNMFESDFDFTADTRRGDRFRLLVEKRYAGDTFVSYGNILAAQYASGGRTLTGIGYGRTKGDKIAYYDLAGRSLRKSFLKSPLEFTRMTSGFTYARPHPILGGVRPHLAIDYAAPVGTPVRAVADGTVVRAGWNEGNGIQVHLRHRSGYETVYNHLSAVARGLRPGTRVSQRQVIGYVGATGLATGPHLDYRIAKGGTFVNPLGEKFIPGEPISAAEKSAFLRESRALIERLESEAPF
jgi:murein DD-endopeptidase MepM/ murein hydrolase activator NlpD